MRASIESSIAAKAADEKKVKEREARVQREKEQLRQAELLSSRQQAQELQSDSCAEMEVEKVRQAAVKKLSEGDVVAAIAKCREGLSHPSLSAERSSVAQSTAVTSSRLALLNLLTTALLSAGGREEEVVKTCGAMLDIDPQHFKARLRRADAYLKLVRLMEFS